MMNEDDACKKEIGLKKQVMAKAHIVFGKVC
jgi:hypothetical protein